MIGDEAVCVMARVPSGRRGTIVWRATMVRGPIRRVASAARVSG
ncbi:hypothetical protein DB32_005755 [Sandaracinus amylolyticus]|uniref:Uncharacterized protein n=1 Tax=Sandaracinus amylolyticus TaxID=927083 RepID=A0A0F6W6C3_9BACT|nr:hypothetical protein DB32_005755 [Sandaracinus amylolyticus]